MTRLLSVSCVVLLAALPSFAKDVRFNRDVRPILAANCFHCHGPDEGQRQAELRFDEEAGIKKSFAGGLAKSEAWRRTNSKDPDEKMPPAEAHRELKAAQISTLKQWVEDGAPWEGHWSFIRPVRPAMPGVKAKAWVRNPIDAFILQRLETEGLTPGSEADRERLLRRVYFDLTGLPPSIKQIDAFLNDKSENAYGKVVDELLASKAFGERMALMWMDAARYGDSSVFHADGPRDMWPWRDWVINAYNSNKPFNEFTVEQLAGDLIPNATNDQKIATGFNRNNATTDEGGAIAEEYRVEYAVDRVKTTSMVWLGLSLECAQCHNHKYDPITMTDYYRFFAFFNQASDPGMQSRRGNQTPVVDVFDAQKLAQAAILKQDLPKFEEELKKHVESIEPAFLAWLEKASTSVGDKPSLPGGAIAHLTLDGDLSDLADPKRKAQIKGKSQYGEGKFGQAFLCDTRNWVDAGQLGDFDNGDAFSYGCWIKPKGNANGAPITKMNDGNAYRGYDMLFGNGRLSVHIVSTWPTNAIKVNTKKTLKKDAWQHVFVTYDGSSKAAGVKIYFDGKPQEWTIEQDRLSATIRTKAAFQLGRRSPGGPFNGLIDDVRVYDRALTEAEVGALAGSDPIGPLLAMKPEERTKEQHAQLRLHYLNSEDKAHRQLSKKIRDLKVKIAEHEKPVSNVMVMADVGKMRTTYILDRGNYASPLKEKVVAPGVLSALPQMAEGVPQNRLGLAKWLVDPRHPLTARVTVNRYWSMMFGAGLVKSLGDFGSQGEWPSHPALLDWLAVDFVESGWDIKRMLKQMVMSATYRQSTRVSSELLEKDPNNLLLARGPRFRLQGEFIRDNALAASGLLVRKIGGPSVKPYQPPGLWNEVSLSGARFTQDKGEKLYRRSMYTYWKRSSPAPAMTIFDARTREKCVLLRSRTNTPLQALVTLNDVQFVEASRSLAERAIKAEKELDAQIVTAYRLATGVRPKPVIQEILGHAYLEELAIFKEDTERAKKLISLGESKRDESIDAAQHAAMTIVTSMILNLDETLTRG